MKNLMIPTDDSFRECDSLAAMAALGRKAPYAQQETGQCGTVTAKNQ